MTAVLYHIERPSGAPVLLVPVIISTTTIRVSWREVNCTEHNGDFIGYNVQYSIVGGMGSPISILVRDDVTSTEISGLTQFMIYTVSVTAININGIGPYSSNEHVIYTSK